MRSWFWCGSWHDQARCTTILNMYLLSMTSTVIARFRLCIWLIISGGAGVDPQTYVTGDQWRFSCCFKLDTSDCAGADPPTYPSTVLLLSQSQAVMGEWLFKGGRLMPWALQKLPYPTYRYRDIISSNPVDNVLTLKSSFSLCHPCDVGYQLLPSICEGKLQPFKSTTTL